MAPPPQWSPTDAHQLATIDADGQLSLLLHNPGTASIEERSLARDGGLRAICWDGSGESIWCGHADGNLRRVSVDGSAPVVVAVDAPGRDADAELTRPFRLSDHFLLVVFERRGESFEPPYIGARSYISMASLPLLR